MLKVSSDVPSESSAPGPLLVVLLLGALTAGVALVVLRRAQSSRR